MKIDLFPAVGTVIELNRSNTKLAINTSYRLNCKWDTGLYKIWLIILKEIVTMTTTDPCEMSGLSPKFSGVGSKLLSVPLFRPNLFIEDDSRRRRWCHSTVKPAKKSFAMVMFQHSVSNLLHNVFCSFPNSFPKVSVVNLVHRQKKGSKVWKSSFGGRRKAQVCPEVYA